MRFMLGVAPITESHGFSHPGLAAHMEIDMAKNPPVGDNARRGAVRDRSQVYNPVTEVWIKRDTETGQFMDQKKDGDPFKGVRKEHKK